MFDLKVCLVLLWACRQVLVRLLVELMWWTLCLLLLVAVPSTRGHLTDLVVVRVVLRALMLLWSYGVIGMLVLLVNSPELTPLLSRCTVLLEGLTKVTFSDAIRLENVVLLVMKF